MFASCRRLLLGGAAALLIASCATAPPQSPSDAEIAAKLGPSAPLLPLYRALSRGAATVVVILQIGDSHTANDSFSGRLRELFQARFGDAGRGVLPPGVPYRWYRPARVTVTSEGWSVVSSYRGDPGPFGITGLRQHADGPAEMTLFGGRCRRSRPRRDRGAAPAGRRHARCRARDGRPHIDCHGGAGPAGGVAAGAIGARQPHADAACARRRAGGRAGLERRARPARRDLRQPRHRGRRRRSDGRLGPGVAAPGPRASVRRR